MKDRVSIHGRAAVSFLSLLAVVGGAASSFADEKAEVAPGTKSAGPPGRAERESELVKKLRERVARAGGLTAEEAAARAVATSTGDLARKADVDAATAEIDRAKVDYFPRLTATARYTRLSPIKAPAIPGVPAGLFPVIVDQYLLQANVMVPLSDYWLRIGQSHDAALAQREATELTAAAARRSVATEAKLAYYAWARARLAEVATEEAVDQATHHLELSRAARDAGRAFNADVLRAESLVAAAELANTRMKNAASLGAARLRTAMHDSRSEYEIGEDLMAPLGAADAGDADALYAEALSNRPEFRALRSTSASLRSQRTAAASRGLPRLDAFGNAYLANPTPRVIPQSAEWRATWDIGVQVTWSPNDLGGADATTHAVDAKQKHLDAERAALADALRDEIAGAKLAWSEARSSAETADRGLVSAEEAYRVRRELFELGRGTDVELVDAESDVLRARLEMIQARVDARVAKARLEHAVGRDAGPH